MSIIAIIISSIVVASGIGVGVYFKVKSNSSSSPTKPGKNSKQPVILKVTAGKIQKQQ